MSTIASLLSEIETFCAEVKIAEATFGTRAAKDGKFVGRLRRGAGITVATVDRVRAYIAVERAKRTTPSARDPSAGSGQAARGPEDKTNDKAA